MGLEPKIIFETADIDGIEIIIRAKELTPDVETIISKVGIEKATMQAYYNGAAVNIRLDDIIRFYRDGRDVRAQTSKNSFVIKNRCMRLKKKLYHPISFGYQAPKLSISDILRDFHLSAAV